MRRGYILKNKKFIMSNDILVEHDYLPLTMSNNGITNFGYINLNDTARKVIVATRKEILDYMDMVNNGQISLDDFIKRFGLYKFNGNNGSTYVTSSTAFFDIKNKKIVNIKTKSQNEDDDYKNMHFYMWNTYPFIINNGEYIRLTPAQTNYYNELIIVDEISPMKIVNIDVSFDPNIQLGKTDEYNIYVSNGKAIIIPLKYLLSFYAGNLIIKDKDSSQTFFFDGKTIVEVKQNEFHGITEYKLLPSVDPINKSFLFNPKRYGNLIIDNSFLFLIDDEKKEIDLVSRNAYFIRVDSKVYVTAEGFLIGIYDSETHDVLFEDIKSINIDRRTNDFDFATLDQLQSF